MTAKVKLQDKDGKVHEMDPANARDMVQHKGWSYVQPEDDTVNTDRNAAAEQDRLNKLAHAPRRIQGDVDARVAAAQQRATASEPAKNTAAPAAPTGDPEADIAALEGEERDMATFPPDEDAA